MNPWSVIASYDESKSIIARCETEADAEEVGAAMALAGFDVIVTKDGEVYHEFFTTE